MTTKDVSQSLDDISVSLQGIDDTRLSIKEQIELAKQLSAELEALADQLDSQSF